MDTKECTWCQYMKSLYSRDLEAELKQYIESMPEEIKVTDEVYAKRLAICSSCEDCVSGICRYCGCFVAARTVKKVMTCPKIGQKKW